jgi:GNAT superfamily N-acetyltransferase
MITLKTVEAKDQLFIEKLYRSTRENELNFTNWTEEEKNIFCLSQMFAQLAEYKNKYKDATYQVIIYKKKPVGRLYLNESDKETRVLDISILPAFRGRGIGRSILTDIIKKARQKNKITTLNVAIGNPAKKLYESIGFKKISASNTHEYMEC